MLKTLKYIFPLICLSMVISACSSDEDEKVQPEVKPIEPTVAPVAIEKKTTVKNDYFQISYGDSWKLISQEGPHAPAFISLQKNDFSTTVTIRVSKNGQSIDELCKSATKVFMSQDATFTDGPKVEHGTCTIKSDNGEKQHTLWMRVYNDVGLVYSINFEGIPAVANQVLSTLQGDERMMQLLVMPL